MPHKSVLNILLIQPSQKVLIGKRKKFGSIMPPLGLLQLASCIRTECTNTKISILDFEAKSYNENYDFSTYDIIGVSGTSVHIPHATQIIKCIRKKNKKVCIVMGGAHATFAPIELLETIPELDAVIVGEGELSLVEFISNFTSRDNLPRVNGCITREVSIICKSPIVENLDELPELAYDCIDMNDYQLSTHRNALPMPFICLMTSRGCPFSCDYCQTPRMFGSKVRRRSAELVYDELLKLKQSIGLKSVIFWDDTFTADNAYTEELCEYLDTLNIKWMCNTRVECVNKKLLKKMKQAGCEIIFFGIESFDIDTLNDLHRTSREESVRLAFNLCKEVGIRTVGSLMIGTPNDDFIRIEKNIKSLVDLNPDDVYISIFNAVIGSATYQQAVRSGTLTENIDWSDATRYRGSPFGLPTINNKLNRYQLQMAQKNAYRKFYGKGNEKQYE